MGTLSALWLRVTTETLLTVAFAQQPIDCEYLLNNFIMAQARYSQYLLHVLAIYYSRLSISKY